MPNGLLNRVLDSLIKGVVGVFMTGSGYWVFEGRWFGQMIFSSYLTEWKFSLLGQPPLDDSYRVWGSQSIPLSFHEIPIFMVPLSLFLLLGLMAHVLYKSSVAEQFQKVQNRHPAKRVYLRHYHFFTFGFFFLLACLFLLWSMKSGLVVLLILLLVPITFYLVRYSRDLLKGTFPERLVYASLFLFLLVAVFGWPHLYGSRVFNPEFTVADLSESVPDRCNMPSKGPVFLVNEGKKLFARVCFDQRGNRFMDVFKYSGDYRFVGKDSLSNLARNYVPPVSGSESAESLAKLETLFQ